MPQEHRRARLQTILTRRIQISYSSAAILTVEDGTIAAVDAAACCSEPAPSMALKIVNFQRAIYAPPRRGAPLSDAEPVQHARAAADDGEVPTAEGPRGVFRPGPAGERRGQRIVDGGRCGRGLQGVGGRGDERPVEAQQRGPPSGVWRADEGDGQGAAAQSCKGARGVANENETAAL
ncbi:hypothetical protein THAOC_05767 [Thalassiosira oceanica]|uniref:Uncharacterized protein n=1 Tax=Thalassiosira oceanica TaxID=159749 RepID=K0T241_THAOC|nr:hypothetical protein THAOC_05767 [Thalassiosira oceanica]|eukprot:EJK72678.1 hypothetical protein THAOC_05767 [Thalassiosira oceanica]